MGNVISRCAQNIRNTLRSCSKKHTEEEAMLSTCDSEPLDKCQEPLFDPSVSVIDRGSSVSRTGSQASLMRLQEKIEPVNCKLSSSTPKTNAKFGSSAHHHSHCNKGYQTIACSEDIDCDCGPLRPRSFTDQESQTNFEETDAARVPSPEPCILSKEYIVKTYSIQNATPTPSPATQTKFPPVNRSASPPQTPAPVPEVQTPATGGSPLAHLERRQDDVLKRLGDLQASVSRLAQKYNVSATQPEASATAVSAKTTGKAPSATRAPVNASQGSQGPALGSGDSVLDLVISVDPSTLPLSLVVLCQQLSEKHRVLKSTFIHSSVSDKVPEKLHNLLVSNGGIKRSDCQVAVSLVWKSVTNGPHLMVNPTRQTTIQGEANIARYLARLLDPSYDSDIVTATQIDEFLDIAQLQIIEGNSKERAAAVRNLNSALGKRNWLVGSSPSVADIVCWSALNQTQQTSNPPANVKKWLASCGQNTAFQTAAQVLS